MFTNCIHASVHRVNLIHRNQHGNGDPEAVDIPLWTTISGFVDVDNMMRMISRRHRSVLLSLGDIYYCWSSRPFTTLTRATGYAISPLDLVRPFAKSLRIFLLDFRNVGNRKMRTPRLLSFLDALNDLLPQIGQAIFTGDKTATWSWKGPREEVRQYGIIWVVNSNKSEIRFHVGILTVRDKWLLRLLKTILQAREEHPPQPFDVL